MSLKERFAKTGIAIEEVLIPKKNIDFSKWAVVACDQYSSEKGYWEDVSRRVGASPSTLNLIFPECYLEDEDKKERVHKIQSEMKNYLEQGLFEKVSPGVILVDRKTNHSPSRKGLIVSIDLEKYEYKPGVKSMVRPSEGTIVQRLPPRMEIRRGASLELPHILLLIDDPSGSVIEKAYSHCDRLPLLYDFELMKDSGHLKGWHVNDPVVLEEICQGLEALLQKSDLLYAVGDGNHSLATAKAIWEELKQKGAQADHPARFALVELENIYDPGIEFEPIHRVLFHLDCKKFLMKFEEAFHPRRIECASEGEMDKNNSSFFRHRIKIVSENENFVYEIENDAELTVEFIQEFLDSYLKNNPSSEIDYIHGDLAFMLLSKKPGNLGIFLTGIDKKDFFPTVHRRGNYPRKTFSMGEADEKRFYVEARRLL